MNLLRDFKINMIVDINKYNKKGMVRAIDVKRCKVQVTNIDEPFCGNVNEWFAPDELTINK